MASSLEMYARARRTEREQLRVQGYASAIYAPSVYRKECWIPRCRTWRGAAGEIRFVRGAEEVPAEKERGVSSVLLQRAGLRQEPRAAPPRSASSACAW